MFHIAGITLKRRLLSVAVPVSLLLGSSLLVSAQDDNTQTSKLYKLQATYHRAATVRDPINGDSPEMITARLREVLSLFTADAVLYLTVGNANFDGYYLGNGDPDDATTCPPPSVDPKNRGTLCTFYKYLSPAFQATNKLVALTPSYKEFFDVHGRTAAVYFECHYFNVAIDPATQRPFWTAVSHASFNGLARKVDGRWLFSYANGAVPPVPIP